MKNELTLEDFSIKNGEEFQEYYEFLGIGRRKKMKQQVTAAAVAAAAAKPLPPPQAIPSVIQKILNKQPSNADQKLEAICKSPLIKRTKKCRDYYEKKLRQEQEAARLAAEAAAKEAAKQSTLVQAAVRAVQVASTQKSADLAKRNAELSQQLADLRLSQANIAKQRVEELKQAQEVLNQTPKNTEISNNQAQLIDKILSESTLDKMQQAVAESPILQKSPEGLPVDRQVPYGDMTKRMIDEGRMPNRQTTDGSSIATIAEGEEGGEPVKTTGVSTTATTAGAPAKNNMLLYGAIGVGVLLLLFRKSIFGTGAAATATS